MNKSEIQKEVREFIGSNNIDSAMMVLNDSLNPQSLLFEQLIIIKSRYSDYRTEFRKGTISRENGELQINKVRSALLEITKSISKEDLIIPTFTGQKEKITDEELKRYDEIFLNYQRRNQTLNIEVQKLNEEIEKLKLSDPRLRLKNTIEMNFRAFKRFAGIGSGMEGIMMKIDEDINSIDPGFAITQIEKLENNLDTLSRIAQNINILKEKLLKDEGFRELEWESITKKFFGIMQFCENEMILNEDSIVRTANELEKTLVNLEKLEEVEIMKREEERHRKEKEMERRREEEYNRKR